MISVGIVGVGFVGNALREVFLKKGIEVWTYDKKLECNCEDLSALVALSDVIFVCVPTPMKSDGSCDTSVVRSVVHQINDLALAGDDDLHTCVLIKSTVTPGTTLTLARECKKITVGFNPEFLTEASAVDDFLNDTRVVIGLDSHDTQRTDVFYQWVERLYRHTHPDAEQVWLHSREAELVKYVGNCFLATKVSFANEIWQICKALGVSYEAVIKTVTLDPRIAPSHWKVPGPMPATNKDGTPSDVYLPGFSGSCFVKDINSLISFARSLDVKPTVLEAAWKKNLEVRPERDWEYLVGRAVVDTEGNKNEQ